ncbi:MAG: transposase [Bryobacterales bacterium]|nr:transposase [Bryobacterales bacterium]
MIDKGQRHLVYGYNAQAAVDGHAQVIVSAELAHEETFPRMLLPMLSAVEETMGEKPKAIAADAGYWDTEDVNSNTLEGTLALVNPDGGKKKEGAERKPGARIRRWSACGSCSRPTKRRRFTSRRTTIVEPVFGQIKEQRGIREFRLRGIKKTKAEWQLICLTHNLLKLYHYDWAPQRGGKRPVSRAKGKSEQKTPGNPSCGPKANLFRETGRMEGKERKAGISVPPAGETAGTDAALPKWAPGGSFRQTHNNTLFRANQTSQSIFRSR